jgi:hypothetical protein
VQELVGHYNKFQEPIGSLIKHGTWSAKVAGSEFASQGVQLAQPATVESPGGLIERSTAEGTPATEDIETLRSSFDEMRTFAMTHYCLHMDLVLAAKSKALLLWLQSKGHVDFPTFETIVQAISTEESEANNIRQVVFNNGLALIESGTVRLQPLGLLYLDWRRDSNLPTPPPLASFIAQDAAASL